MAYQKKCCRKEPSSNCPGVCWNAQLSKWMVRITRDKQKFYLGVYADLDDAIAVREDIENRADIVRAVQKLAVQRKAQRKLVVSKRNSSGCRGVSIHMGKYIRARITTIGGERINLGSFRTVAEATKAYQKAQRRQIGK